MEETLREKTTCIETKVANWTFRRWDNGWVSIDIGDNVNVLAVPDDEWERIIRVLDTRVPSA